MTVRSGRCRRDWDIPAFVLSLIFCASTFANDERRGAQGLSQPTVCPMARDIGTCLIEPKTPFYRRFDLLALALPNRP